MKLLHALKKEKKCQFQLTILCLSQFLQRVYTLYQQYNMQRRTLVFPTLPLKLLTDILLKIIKNTDFRRILNMFQLCFAFLSQCCIPGDAKIKYVKSEKRRPTFFTFCFTLEYSSYDLFYCSDRSRSYGTSLFYYEKLSND